jgi:O-antigen/teichoic acid export membrane protein
MSEPVPASSPRSLARPRFSAAVSLTYSTSVGASLLSLFSVLITSRALGPDGRGKVVFLMSVASITAALATLGVEESSANLAGSRSDLRAAVATNALLLAALLGFASAGIVSLLVALDPSVGGHSRPLLRWLAMASISVLILQFYLQYLLRADYAFMVANVALFLSPLVNVTVNGLLFALGLITVTSAFVTWIAGQLLATGVMAWYVGKRLGGFGKPDVRLARHMLGFGVKAHAGRVMMTGNYRLDQWILGAVAPAQELGLYSIAVAWSEGLFFLPDALALVMRPDLIRASRREAGDRAAGVFRVATLVTLPMVIGTVIAAPVLCVTVFGHAFSGSIDQLRKLAPGVFGMLAMKVMANALIAQGRPLLSNIAIACAFALTLGLDILLIPSHGGIGAAAASTTAYIGGGIAMAAVFKRTLGVRVADLVPRRADLARLRSSVTLRRSAAPQAGVR